MPATPENPDGRSASGRFTPGNRHGRGNPHARRMSEIRQALLDSVDPATAGGLIKKMGELALGGDVPAARVWLEYVVGKPAQAIELSGAEGGPLLSVDRLTSVILSALGGFPEARVHVAVALRKAMNDDRAGDDESPGDGARPLDPDGGLGFNPGPVAEGGSPLDL